MRNIIIGWPHYCFAGKGCVHSGIAQHEMLHAIGFFHEQSRPDRDQHIHVNENNIKPSELHNFKKERPSDIDTHGTKYDINSLMHYKPGDFSKNGGTVITALKGNGANMGQRNGLSPTDKYEVSKQYGCSGGGKGSQNAAGKGQGKRGKNSKGKRQNDESKADKGKSKGKETKNAKKNEKDNKNSKSSNDAKSLKAQGSKNSKISKDPKSSKDAKNSKMGEK